MVTQKGRGVPFKSPIKVKKKSRVIFVPNYINIKIENIILNIPSSTSITIDQTAYQNDKRMLLEKLMHYLNENYSLFSFIKLKLFTNAM